jgi:hypothetical protein
MIETITTVNKYGNFNVTVLIGGKPMYGKCNIKDITQLTEFQERIYFKLINK